MKKKNSNELNHYERRRLAANCPRPFIVCRVIETDTGRYLKPIQNFLDYAAALAFTLEHNFYHFGAAIDRDGHHTEYLKGYEYV